jgi:hypothetical protein
MVYVRANAELVRVYHLLDYPWTVLGEFEPGGTPYDTFLLGVGYNGETIHVYYNNLLCITCGPVYVSAPTRVGFTPGFD